MTLKEQFKGFTLMRKVLISKDTVAKGTKGQSLHV